MYDRVIVATKGAHPSGQKANRLEREDILSDLDQSLSNLGLDTIPLYWLHRDDPARDVGEIIETMNEACSAGKIRHFGCSNWRAERIAKANRYARDHGLKGFAASQICWSVGFIPPERISDKTLVYMDDAEYMWYEKSRMTVAAYSSQARGYFAKLDKGQALTSASVYDNSVNRRRFYKLREVAQAKDVNITGAVTAFIASNPVNGIPIIGCSNAEQLEDSLRFCDAELTCEEIEYILSSK